MSNSVKALKGTQSIFCYLFFFLDYLTASGMGRVAPWVPGLLFGLQYARSCSLQIDVCDGDWLELKI